MRRKIRNTSAENHYQILIKTKADSKIGPIIILIVTEIHHIKQH